MKKTLWALVFLFMALNVTVALPAAAGDPVRLAPLRRSYPIPSLGRKQGWLTISNQDWHTYFLQLGDKDKLFLHREGGGAYGGVMIPSGASVTIAMDKDNYDLYGNTGDRLRVKVREGRTTTLTLEPTGFIGNTGLDGIVNDGDRVRRETLFRPNVIAVPAPPPPVIVQPAPPPVIVHPAPPPPPPVVVVPPRPPHRPPPPPPPHRPGRPRDDGWGFFFEGGRR